MSGRQLGTPVEFSFTDPEGETRNFSFPYESLTTLAEFPARAKDAFRFAVEQLVKRRNSVNGRPYREDPTIMSWQLANEPRAVHRLVRKLECETPGPIRVFYEAGPCGYALQRQVTT